MSWIMEVKLDGKWTPVKAKHMAQPYHYRSREEAERTLRICYPDQIREHGLGMEETVRVRNVGVWHPLALRDM